jgi:formylglycine-generating enzyme required for sulfatase activity
MIAADRIEAGKTEITYAQWKPVFQWAEAHGYQFANNGDIGSMGWLPGTHAQDEPVADVGILDAAVWCNALSEMKGLIPCYYADEALTQPLKIANPFRTNSYQWTLKTTRFNAHPPIAFPKFLFHFDPVTAWFADNSAERTHPGATATPTANGFHDLTGNVFEWAAEPKNPTRKPVTSSRSASTAARSARTPKSRKPSQPPPQMARGTGSTQASPRRKSDSASSEISRFPSASPFVVPHSCGSGRVRARRN